MTIQRSFAPLSTLLAASLFGCAASPGDEEDIFRVAMDFEVLVDGACVTDLPEIDAHLVDEAIDGLEMTPAEREAAGYRYVTLSQLSPTERRLYADLQESPCAAASGEWTCVSGTGGGGHHWAVCTNGTVTCGVGTSGPYTPTTAWCR